MECGISADTHFGPRVLPCRREFDFTLLFEQAILALTPDLLFFILCLFQCFHMRGEPKKVRRGAAGTWKMVISTLLLALKIVLLVLWCLPHSPRTKISVPSAAVAVTSTLALTLRSFYEYTRSLRPSSLICIYLLGSIIFEIPQVRTLWLLRPTSYSYPIAATATITLTTCSLLLLLETKEKRNHFSPQYGHISLESSTGIFSHSTYCFRGNLSLDNLLPLDEELTSKSIASRHHQQWKYNEVKCTRRLALLCNIIYDLKWIVVAAVVPRLCLIRFKFA
ncbi:P-loop containing nucleoside triphosphate hydrolase protein [Penicillium cf. griseofulvum]|nr:P-loop containing nucleoside triphosphate hydrolase protein [Penicillium cf. griseofulvum]